ncbi:hypothetical protein GCM10025869_11080 [Homoserinibacter gongjuensis]|uniref:Uncharacterized protein n=1 Tax=Homoserinibacter gongjuensis TaxID=1162968 RepID=A0ABQ6JTE1_9MICO|nr:hypothetical protein GCM10025869_11080 [Homoserinibacter gongjuensis]
MLARRPCKLEALTEHVGDPEGIAARPGHRARHLGHEPIPQGRVREQREDGRDDERGAVFDERAERHDEQQIQCEHGHHERARDDAPRDDAVDARQSGAGDDDRDRGSHDRRGDHVEHLAEHVGHDGEHQQQLRDVDGRGPREPAHLQSEDPFLPPACEQRAEGECHPDDRDHERRGHEHGPHGIWDRQLGRGAVSGEARIRHAEDGREDAGGGEKEGAHGEHRECDPGDGSGARARLTREARIRQKRQRDGQEQHGDE